MIVERKEMMNVDTVKDMAVNFFKQNYTVIDVQDAVLKKGVWVVKVVVSTFGKQSDHHLSIESQTGKIISCA